MQKGKGHSAATRDCRLQAHAIIGTSAKARLATGGHRTTTRGAQRPQGTKDHKITGAMTSGNCTTTKGGGGRNGRESN
jgi:hypothetical protein